MEKYFCGECLSSFYLTYDEEVKAEGKPNCLECGRRGDTPASPIVYKGYVGKTLFKVTRTWYVKAHHYQEALDETKNWNHSEVRTEKINPQESFIE
jgi:hypothetical protein